MSRKRRDQLRGVFEKIFQDSIVLLNDSLFHFLRVPLRNNMDERLIEQQRVTSHRHSFQCINSSSIKVIILLHNQFRYIWLLCFQTGFFLETYILNERRPPLIAYPTKDLHIKLFQINLN